MSTKKIEDLDEQTILGDGDLMFMSESNGNGFDSKKVTLANIANYVRRTISSTSGNDSGTGYEIYRMSESNVGDYIYEQSVNGSWTKTFNEDCEILMTPVNVGTITRIDGVRINTDFMVFGVGDHAQFYVKAGQTLTIDTNDQQVPETIVINSRPLKSGGNFFIDTGSQNTETIVEDGETKLQWKSPFTMYRYVNREHNGATNEPLTFTATKPTLFCWCSRYVATGQETTGVSSVKLNGLEIGWKHTGSESADKNVFYDKLVLDTNDVLTINFADYGDYLKYCALPLIAIYPLT